MSLKRNLAIGFGVFAASLLVIYVVLNIRRFQSRYAALSYMIDRIDKRLPLQGPSVSTIAATKTDNTIDRRQVEPKVNIAEVVEENDDGSEKDEDDVDMLEVIEEADEE